MDPRWIIDVVVVGELCDAAEDALSDVILNCAEVGVVAAVLVAG